MSRELDTDHIEYRRVMSPSTGSLVKLASTGDTYTLHAPLARNYAQLKRDGKIIYEGEVRAGMLGVVAPGETTTIRLRGSGEGIGIVVPGPLFRRFVESEPESSSRAVTCRVSGLVNLNTPHPTVERLARALLLVEELPAGERQLYLKAMVLGLATVLRHGRHDPADERVRRREGLSDREFSQCAHFAEAHLDRRVDLASWAAALKMSTNEFGRRFHLKTGMSPYQWLLDLRIDRARRLLEVSSLPLAEISLQLGFCSQSHFTDTFRRRHGISPGHWRKNRRHGFL